MKTIDKRCESPTIRLMLQIKLMLQDEIDVLS